MGGRREVSIISYRPVTRNDLKQERSFFRGSVSTFLQLVVAMFNNSKKKKKNDRNDDILLYGYNNTRTLMGCFLVMTEHYQLRMKHIYNLCLT